MKNCKNKFMYHLQNEHRNNEVILTFLNKFEKCVNQYKKNIQRRVVLKLGRYIRGNHYHLKILQLKKVVQLKNMVSCYLTKRSEIEAKKIQNSESNDKNCNVNNAESVNESIKNRLEDIRNKRKKSEEKTSTVQDQISNEEKPKTVDKVEQTKDEPQPSTSSAVPSTSSSAPTSLPRSRSFFDKLLSKINRSNSGSNEDVTIIESTKEDEAAEISSNSSCGFRGFHENDLEEYKSPFDDITDFVENKSAFISEELEVFLKENALENCSNIRIPTIKFEYEEGMIHSGSVMPTMEVPKQLVKRKARTVAEKRLILETKKDIKYVMVENESTIYWELQRRAKKNANCNYDLITTIQNQDVPVRRGVWKIASWLATQPGLFYFQGIDIEHNNKKSRINLYGGRGNFETKLINLKSPSFKRYKTDIKCTLGCNNLKNYPNLNIDLPALLDQTAEKLPEVKQGGHRLNLISNLLKNQRHLKPGPLSSKLKHDSSGELKIFEMPKIQLELFPRLNYEFDKDIKKYLKLIQPSDSITEEWAKFSLATLQVESPTKKCVGRPKKTQQIMTYAFDVPYADNQNKVLTRKELAKRMRVQHNSIYRRGTKNEMDTLDKPLEILAKHIDKDDQVQNEIGDYLNDMFNSTVIGLCQNSIVKNDPDLDYNRKDGVQSQLKGKRINNFHDKKVKKNKSKLLNELRRLNATFIETTDTSENHECHEEHCTLGCVCTDIRKIPPMHCRKEKCMFECTCKKFEEKAYIQRNAIVEDGLSEEDMRLLRDRATCRLAKMEKDFSSTIVLTNDNTILIHNTQVESKRNRKPSKILKGYSTDDIDIDEKPVPPIPPPEKDLKPIADNATKFKAIEYMTHCSVVLDPIPELDNLEVWCMVHCLYKCFCNGNATKGEIFGFNDIVMKNTQHFPPAPAKRRNYTFDKSDNVEQPKATKVSPGPSTSKASTSGALARTSTSGPSPKPSTSGYSGRASTSSSSTRASTSGSWAKAATAKMDKTPVENDDEPLLSRLVAVNCAYHQIKNKAMRRKIMKWANAEEKLHSLLKKRVNDCLYSKRLNQAKKVGSVVIVLSESEDDKDGEDTTITNAGDSRDYEENNDEAVPVQNMDDENDVEQQDESNDDENSNIKPTSESLVEIKPKLKEDVSPKMDSPSKNAVNRIPVDKFIQFSQQINDDIIKSPSSHKTLPVKTENVTKLNLIVTKAMSKICEMQKNNLNDVPDPKLKGFNNISWDNLINIYRNEKIFVWEVRRVSATNSSNLNLLLVITKTCSMPKIDKAVSAVCIKLVRPDDLSTIGKMINLQIVNEKTKNLAVIVYGQLDYWLILGCIHSDINYLEDGVFVRPTPVTHPLLASKINRLNSLLLANPFLLQNRNTKTTPIVPLQLPEVKTNPCCTLPLQTTSHKTNIEIVPYSRNDNNSLFLPIPVIGDHRWFMLTIENDFSDIYIPTWQSFLKYERIVATHKIARSRSKTVRILHMNNEQTVPHVFITPRESNKIFFGPYRVDQDVSMVLCQELDGEMLSREIYEERTKINKGKRTNGCWLYVKNNEIVPNKANQNAAYFARVSNKNDDDVIFLDEKNLKQIDTVDNKNDCIIIEDDEDDEIIPPPPPLVDGKMIILEPRESPIATVSKVPCSDTQNKSTHYVHVENANLTPTTSTEIEIDERDPLETESENLKPVGVLGSARMSTPETISSFSITNGSCGKRSKGVYSILKPIQPKPNDESIEKQSVNLTIGPPRCTSPNLIATLAAPKPVSILKNQLSNGGFLKLKPLSQISSPIEIACSLSPPPTEPIISPSDINDVAPSKLIQSPAPTLQNTGKKDEREIPGTIRISASKIIDRRKTLDASAFLNRTQPRTHNFNSPLGKRKSDEFPMVLKKPLLNSNIKVCRKQISEDLNTVASVHEPIKMLLKRKNITQNDDHAAKIQILEEPKIAEDKSDAVTIAIKKLSGTSTYIRSNTTSTVTSTTVASTSSAATLPSVTTTTITQAADRKYIKFVPSSEFVMGSNANLHADIKNYQRFTKLPDKRLPNMVILNGADEIKTKGKELIPVTVAHDNDPRLNIKAFIISECIDLGKIPCIINKLNITFKLPTMDKTVTLCGITQLSQFLETKIRETIHSIIPNELDLKWTTTSDRKKLKDYSEIDINTLDRNKVLTLHGLIDLREDFESVEHLKADPVLIVKLLISKLSHMLNDGKNVERTNGPVTKDNAFEILEKTQAYVKQLKADETQLMKTKLTLYKEIYTKKNNLSKLKDAMKTPETTTVGSTQSKLLIIHQNRGSTNKITNVRKSVEATPKASVTPQPPPAKIPQLQTETIVIDDDDDDD